MQEPCSVPLGIAAAKGHTETVHRLLVLGADINHQNKVMIIADPRLSLVHAKKSVLGFNNRVPFCLIVQIDILPYW